MYETIVVQQPRPFDVVGGSVLVAGLATGFEAIVRARVRDGAGQELAVTTFTSGGGAGELGQFQTRLELPTPVGTASGFVEVFEDNAAYPEGEAIAEIAKVAVPVVFGSHLVDGFVGCRFRTVVDGETLSSIAEDEYGDADMRHALYECNRDQIGEHRLIFSGQTLRIPR